MTTASTDAIVIGGGVIGCSIGYHLAKAGVKTTILERGEVGMAASNAASGILSSLFGNPTDPYTRLVNGSLEMFHELAPELAEASGVDIEFAQCGELELALSEDEAQMLHSAVVDGGWRSSEAEWMDAEAVQEMEPMLSDRIAGGIFMPEVCRVNNQRLSAAYARAAERLGATVREHTEVISMVRSGLRISGVRLHNEELLADHVIIAAGPWSSIIAGNAWKPCSGAARSRSQPELAAYGSQHQDCYSRRLGLARAAQRRFGYSGARLWKKPTTTTA